jgi:aspartyl-tRNA synthetase
MFAGVEYEVPLRSLIANEEGACCIVNNRNDAVEGSSSIVLCGIHANIKRGLKILLNGNISEYHGGCFVFYTDLFIQPVGKPMMDVYTHFFTLSQSYTSMSNIVSTNTTNIATNTYDILINAQNIGSNSALIVGLITKRESLMAREYGRTQRC